MTPVYARIRSWHVVASATRVPGSFVTRCGLRASGPAANELPLDEPSCETCLRLARRDEEKAS